MFARLVGCTRSVPLAIPVVGVALLIGSLGTVREAAAQGTAPRYNAPSDSTPAVDRPRVQYRIEEPQPAGQAPTADRDSFPVRDPAGGVPAGLDVDVPTESPLRGVFPPADVPPEDATTRPPATVPGEIQLAPPAQPSNTPSTSDAEYRDLIDKLAAPPDEAPTEAEPLRSLGELQFELRDVLRERETELREEYVAGNASLTELLRATDEVFQVELSLVGTKEERIGLLGKYIDSLNKFEAKAEPLVRAGSLRVTRPDYMFFKAVRLKALIALAQEQGGELGAAANSPAGGPIGAAREEFRSQKAKFESGTTDAASLTRAGVKLCQLLAEQAEAAGDYGQALQYTQHAQVFASRNHEAVQAAYIAAEVPLNSVDEAETQLTACMAKIQRLQRLAGIMPGQ